MDLKDLETIRLNITLSLNYLIMAAASANYSWNYLAGR